MAGINLFGFNCVPRGKLSLFVEHGLHSERPMQIKIALVGGTDQCKNAKFTAKFDIPVRKEHSSSYCSPVPSRTRSSYKNKTRKYFSAVQYESVKNSL